jgi:hypothetical protein
MAQFHFIGGDGKTYGPYSREQMQQFMAENRVNAQTQVSADGGAWQPAGQYPELAGTTGAPAAPGMLQPMAASPGTAQAMVKGPAIFMMVLSIVNIIYTPLNTIYQLTGGNTQNVPEEFKMLVGGLGIAINGLWFVTNIVILLGAIKMKNCQSYGLAMTASILCILCDWNCCCLGIGAGIWAIVVLSKPEVKAVFR